MPTVTTPQTTLRSFLYGGAAMLLAFDLFFLIKALLTDNFVPIVPIVAGIFTAAGLLVIVFAEQQGRLEDKREHRRISRVAHQLETPLHALQEDLQQLTDQAETLPAEARLRLKRMETKTQALLENVRDVFLMLQATEQPIAREQRVYNLCTVLESVIEKQRSQAAARNVELIYKLHCQNAPVKVDRSLLQVALGHLIENAITYTMKPGLVNIAVTKGADQARVIIQDRGIGLSESDKKIIWQPFARGSRAQEFDSDGIGVGLTLVRLIIREFGGTVRWQNRDRGMGAQFEIVLPLHTTSGTQGD